MTVNAGWFVVFAMGMILAAPQSAQAKEAGDFMVRLGAIDVFPVEGGAADDGTTVINGGALSSNHSPKSGYRTAAEGKPLRRRHDLGV